MSAQEHDYVIVGAGSAGCTLAARLTEDPSLSVLLLEAGGRDRSPNIKIPAAFAKQFHTKGDWDYFTEPEPHCDGRRLYSPRGKTLGGCSSMNAMLYVRGRPLDYDLWEKDYGAAGWGWDAVLPYFKRAEDNERGADDVHGVGGPLRVSNLRSPHRTTHEFVAAAEAAGIRHNPDLNAIEQDGVGYNQATQRNGCRWSTADAYLRPAAKRSNLTVATNAQALGLELEGTRVTGVRYRAGRRGERLARARREVILCGGAYGSPHLLMVSGIGPAAQLEQVGVKVRHDLPAVGQHLQDHPYYVCIWDAKGGPSLADAEKPRAMAEWLLRRSGPLTSPVAEACAFVRTRPGLPAADIQYHFAPAYFVKHGEEAYEGHAITIGPALVTVKSRGWVRLASADPLAKPLVCTNSLSEPEDVESLVAGVELAREIAASGPLRDSLGREIYPGPGVTDRADIEAELRQRVELLYHPSCSCRMGAPDDADAVLDPELRVRGLDGIRVADASVFPVVPGGNTNAPTIMVAEKAADHIRGRIGAAPAASAAA